jgi:8-oxo-dGTP diphosphatase
LNLGRREPPRLIVVGVDVLGTEVVRLVLGHGDDPTALLAVHGWEVLRARDVVSRTVEKHVLTMSFVVEPLVVEPLAVASFELELPPHRDQGLAVAQDEVPEPYQRVAAYAFVTSPRGVLMTQFSDQTNAQGQWGLPGGGLEADEAPDRAVVREVWEESGQVIEVSGLALVQASHWVGRAPTGRLEDFHAVRVVYRASCLEPTEPVVHDVGGTTASAAWVPPADLDRLEVTPGWRALLSAVVMAPDEADGPEHHEQGADADDPAWPQP